MSSLANSTEEINKVRFNLGKTASSNVSDAEIDSALTTAEDTVLEDTGFNTESDPAYEKPDVIKRLKILNATADLLIGFAEKVELRESLLKEIRGIVKGITQPELSDDDDETIIDGIDYETYPLNQTGKYWSGVKQREVRGTGGGDGSNDIFVSWGQY